MNVSLSATTLTLCVTVAIAAVSGAFVIGNRNSSDRIDHLERLAEEYSHSKQLNAPELLSELTRSASKIALSLEERQDLEDSKAINKSLKDEIDQLNRTNFEKTALISSLESQVNQAQLELKSAKVKFSEQLSRFLSEESVFELVEGQAEELVKNHTTLGLEAIYSSWVRVNVNNSPEELRPGNKKDITVDEYVCTLRLLAITGTSAKFKFGCPKIVTAKDTHDAI